MRLPVFRARPALLLPVLLMTLACLPAAAADPRAIERELDALREKHGIAGFALAIVRPGQPAFLGGGGLATREPPRPVTPDTIWRVGSITKSFTGVATLIAAREFGFGLDDPVAKHVPNLPYRNQWEETHPVRIAHLLEHTSGLLDLSRREFDSSDPAPLTLAQAFAVDPDAHTTQWPPGLHSSYSNVGAGIASLVIERVSGLPFDAFLATRVLVPLGMRDSGLLLDERTRGRLATGYDRDGRSVMPYWHVIFRAFGGLNATTADMARYLDWLLRPDGAPLLTAAEKHRMETPHTTLTARTSLRYGYALGLYGYEHEGLMWMGHGGDADGYLSRLGYLPGTGIGYFLTINAFNGDALEEMQGRLESLLTAGLPRPPKPPVAKLAPGELEALAGCYAAATRRFYWTTEDVDLILSVRVEGDRLIARNPMGRERVWLPVNAAHFRRPDEPVATLGFARDADGSLYVQGDMGTFRRTRERPDEPCPPP